MSGYQRFSSIMRVRRKCVLVGFLLIPPRRSSEHAQIASEVLLMVLIYKFIALAWGRALAGILGILLLLVPLASCGGTPAPLRFVTINTGLPSQALNAPVVGPLPDNTKLHVRVTFKINQALLNRLNSQKIQPGQPSHLEKFAKQIGINDATYQKIRNFFSLKGITLKLSKLRTHLAIDASAKTFARLLQTHFVIHRLNGRTFYAPATPPKLPQFLADSIVAITGLDNYSSSPQH